MYLRRRKKFHNEDPLPSEQEAVECELTKAQNALVEQVNATDVLPALQEKKLTSDAPAIGEARVVQDVITDDHTLSTGRSGCITKLHASLKAIKDPAQKQAHLLENAPMIIRDLMLHWTAQDSPSDSQN